MLSEHKELLDLLKNCVIDMDDDRAISIAEEIIKLEIDPHIAISEGLIKAMAEVGEKYENGEYFIPETLLCCDAMNAALEVLKPHLVSQNGQSSVKIVIGVVQGDTHDIGKNLVKMLMETSGFEIYDLGRDVPLNAFVDKAIELDADIIALSTLMTTTMEGMHGVIRLLKDRGVRDNFKVIVGGGPISKAYANEIGADGYSADSSGAVELIKELMKVEELRYA